MTKYSISYQLEEIKQSDYSSFVLGGDVGGTHTDLGIFGLRANRPLLLISFRFSSREMSSIVPAIQTVLRYAREQLSIDVSKACLGAAGPISPDQALCRLTNLDWTIDAREILEQTPLVSIRLINDFEAVGYGIDMMDVGDPSQVMIVQAGKPIPKTNRAVIGAGTGLGKSMLTYSESHGAYIPRHSEGGHGDFPAQNSFELHLLDHVRQQRRINTAVDYEELLSGRGIEAIYLYLRTLRPSTETEASREIDCSNDKASSIACYRETDETCRETFRLFTRFYARCAKNFVLDVFAQGGLYIAGGIAAKNPDIFKEEDFLEEFIKVEQYAQILKDTAIYVIVNENIGLLGAAQAVLTREDLAMEKE